jgi:hypothetical protein
LRGGYFVQDGYAQSFCTGELWGVGAPLSGGEPDRVLRVAVDDPVLVPELHSGALSDVESQCRLYGTRWTTY